MPWLTHDEAVQQMRRAGFDPVGPYPGYNLPWPATCRRAGHEANPTLAAANWGAGCRACGDQPERRRPRPGRRAQAADDALPVAG